MTTYIEYTDGVFETKEEALIRAYCSADPQGNWAKWCKENEVAV